MSIVQKYMANANLDQVVLKTASAVFKCGTTERNSVCLGECLFTMLNYRCRWQTQKICDLLEVTKIEVLIC